MKIPYPAPLLLTLSSAERDEAIRSSGRLHGVMVRHRLAMIESFQPIVRYGPKQK